MADLVLLKEVRPDLQSPRGQMSLRRVRVLPRASLWPVKDQCVPPPEGEAEESGQPAASRGWGGEDVCSRHPEIRSLSHWEFRGHSGAAGSHPAVWRRLGPSPAATSPSGRPSS